MTISLSGLECNSRTRMDMSEAVGGEDYRLTNQRATLGATWGGSDWGIHIVLTLTTT